LVIGLGLAVALVAVVAGWPRGDRNGETQRVVQTAQVTAADFYVALTVEGFLEAARSLPVINIAPETQIVSAQVDGVTVKAGDVLMTLNSKNLQTQADQLQTQVGEAEEKVREAEAEGEKRVQNARSSLVKASEALELARVQGKAGVEKAEAELSFLEKELAVAQGELDKRKRLLAERLVPITEVESAEDEQRDKQFALEAAKRTLERARADAVTNERLRELDISNATLDLAQAESSLETSVRAAERGLEERRFDQEEVQIQLAASEIKAPAAGMLLLDQTWEDGMRPLRVGDQVEEGQRVANIIDPREMLVRTDIAEADIQRVKVGQVAQVQVAAIGEQPLAGKVISIDNLARERSSWEGGVPGRKVFAALIRIVDNDPHLRPGMGATVRIVTDHVTKGLAVPLEAVFASGREHRVYRLEEGRYRELPVKVLKRSTNTAAVEGELRRGDKVALERPTEELLVGGKGERK
jgi:multidrug efflux pump subunit AcrA (membrane-fusion protein)